MHRVERVNEMMEITVEDERQKQNKSSNKFHKPIPLCRYVHKLIPLRRHLSAHSHLTRRRGIVLGDVTRRRGIALGDVCVAATRRSI
jgi:hypothetical protein